MYEYTQEKILKNPSQNVFSEAVSGTTVCGIRKKFNNTNKDGTLDYVRNIHIWILFTRNLKGKLNRISHRKLFSRIRLIWEVGHNNTVFRVR